MTCHESNNAVHGSEVPFQERRKQRRNNMVPLLHDTPTTDNRMYPLGKEAVTSIETAHSWSKEPMRDIRASSREQQRTWVTPPVIPLTSDVRIREATIQNTGSVRFRTRLPQDSSPATDTSTRPRTRTQSASSSLGRQPAHTVLVTTHTRLSHGRHNNGNISSEQHRWCYRWQRQELLHDPSQGTPNGFS